MHSNSTHFLEIIEQHQGIITSLCYAYYTSPEDRKDVRQEIILQLWKSFTTFRGESKVSTWLYRVSLNTILSRRRKEKRHLNTTDTALLNASFEYACDDGHELLNYLLGQLKDVDKAILILQLEGYKNHESAAILGLTTTNIGSRLHRIKSLLRKSLKLNLYGYKKAKK
ncbi:MAG: RNA polymerase sigma factor [Bacteroidota bacterium]